MTADLDMRSIVIVLVIVGLIAVGVAWTRRPDRPMSGDWCRVCMLDLPVGKVYEVRSGHEVDLNDAGSPVGGTFVAATYCRKHAPKGAHRA